MDDVRNEERIGKSRLLLPRDRMLVLGVLILALGAMIGLYVARQSQASAGGSGQVKNGGVATTRPLDIEQIRGIAITIHNGCDTYPYDKYIREIAATGANTVFVVVTAYQQNCGSSSIFIDARKTLPERRLKELFDLCHELKLKIVLMPIVLLENGRDDEWRGKIDPTLDKNTWKDWWEDYDNYILYYAGIAELNKVDIFMVGSELLSTESMTDEWGKLIDEVRGIYKGYLSYSSNWDHYQSVKFWDKLDVIGMTSYYDLCGSKEPTPEVLDESWCKAKADILDWQGKLGKPLLLTEVGWPNQTTCAQQPWNYYGAPDKPAPDLQKQCFESFFKAWGDEPALGGYVIWEWRAGDNSTLPGVDTSYCPMDKPSMDVISKYFHMPNGKRGSAMTATSQPATAPAAVGGESE